MGGFAAHFLYTYTSVSTENRLCTILILNWFGSTGEQPGNNWGITGDQPGSHPRLIPV